MYDSAIAIREVSQEEAQEVIKQLKPGAHFFVICEPTKYHRVACYVEDAGFEIRDQLIWLHEGRHKSIVMARNPLSEGTVAANVLKHQVGGLNIDACRIEAAEGDEPMKWETPRGGIWATDSEAEGALVVNNKGRFPANVIHDGSEFILNEFEKYGTREGCKPHILKSNIDSYEGWGSISNQNRMFGYPDSGTAARFFKTISSLDTMIEYLTNMVTPQNGQRLLLK